MYVMYSVFCRNCHRTEKVLLIFKSFIINKLTPVSFIIEKSFFNLTAKIIHRSNNL